MDDKEIQETLFSKRFHEVYRHLRVFSYLYFLQENQGIHKKEFLQKTQLYHTDTEEIIAFLKEQELFTEQDRLLHLNTSLFFTMSVWDLLIRVEPWIQKPPIFTQNPVSIENQEYNAIKTFAQNQLLSDSYMNNIW